MGKVVEARCIVREGISSDRGELGEGGDMKEGLGEKDWRKMSSWRSKRGGEAGRFEVGSRWRRGEGQGRDCSGEGREENEGVLVGLLGKEGDVMEVVEAAKGCGLDV